MTTRPTREGTRNFRPHEVAEALTKAKGIVAVAAEILGCCRQTVNDHVLKHAEVRKAQEDARESVVDFAEGKLIQKMNQGDLRAIIFMLETQGKKRGYVKRSEMTGADGEPIPAEFTLNFTK